MPSEPPVVATAHERDPPEAAAGGELNAAVARAVVGIYRDRVGRGPTRARAFFRDNVLVVVLQDVLTKGEQSLVRCGQHRTVHQTRAVVQDVMRDELISAVEGLTLGRVTALMSSNDLDSDMAAQVFVLDRALAGAGPVAGRPVRPVRPVSGV